VEDLSEVDGNVDLVVLDSTRQGRTLPPFLGSIDGERRSMGLGRIVRVAVVAQLTLDDLKCSDHVVLVRIGAGQFAEQLRLRDADPASRRRLDLSTDGQVEIGRSQRLTTDRVQ
jgi:hypothetical protein